MITKAALSILSIPILSFAIGSVSLAAAPGAGGPTVRQVAIGQRFAVRPPAANNAPFTLVDSTTGRTASINFQRSGVKEVMQAIKGDRMNLSGSQIGDIGIHRLNQLGVRVGVHTGKHLGSVAYQLLNAKGWQRKGDTYERNAVINGKKRRLSFMVLKGDAGQRVGTLWVRGRRSMKELASDALRSLAEKLFPPHTPDIVKESDEVYSEVN